MGDSERWPQARGLTAEGAHSFRRELAAFHAKGDEWWEWAEARAAELITAIQPNPESEKRRQDIVDYVTKLIQSCVNCKVVQFGSVPLKTYLPDGDIDLTVVSPNPEVKRTWFDDVYNVLKKEIKNPNAEFRVTEVHGVHEAEVKLIKVYVAKLLVDVSFDQLGGVCTLCFLEEVDRLIRGDHLFKRSIILVKAWCYYESRLLGAANNLMSTYALETLVLYIFHIFHASLRGPLQVFYLFLEFFSGFDWDKYCVSLSSPILLASFSEEAERQSNIVEDFQKLALTPWRTGELLFTKAFLDACTIAYGGLMPANQKPHKFVVKSLNIIDPLRSTNNLGRSVNQGNCARIRKAFDLGSQTMRKILNASGADFSTDLNKFFKNCNLRSCQRPDVFAVPSPTSWQPKVPNSVQKSGGAKRDATRADRNGECSHSQNSGHFLPPQVSDLGMEYEGDELSPKIFNERNSSGYKPRGKLERRDFNLESTGVSKQVTTSNGNHGTQPCTNGSTSSSSRNDSEEEEECSFQSSSKGEAIASEYSTSIVVSECRGSLPPVIERLLPLPCRPVNFEATRNGESSSSKGRGRKGSSIQHPKAKRGSKGAWAVDDGKEKVHGRAGVASHHGGMNQVSSSSAGPVPASSYQHVHPARHSSSDAAAGGAHFITAQSRPYPNATGPGSFRHPLANYQFDPGTPRMAAGSSGPSHSSSPQYAPAFYPGYALPGMVSPGFPHVMYSQGMNIHKRNSPAKGDGNSGMNAKNRTGQDTNGSVEGPVESSGDSPRNRSRTKASEQQITVGIVERLEAEGIAATTSSKRNQTVAARNTHGADSGGGGSSSEFLTGDLKLHLDFLAYGPFCEYSCSEYLHHILSPTYASEQHAPKHASWEGPGRALLGPQFYASGPGWLQPFHQGGFFPYFHYPWGGITRGVELSPRPRGTGTYHPTTLRQNIRASGIKGVGHQNGSSQQEDRYHQPREHETRHHLNGFHHRASSASKDEAHAQGSTTNRSAKTEPNPPPKHHDCARASASTTDSRPSEPPVSGPRAHPGEVSSQPSELVLPTTSDSATDPLDVRPEPCNDASGQEITVTASCSTESNGSSDLSEFLSCEDVAVDQGGGGDELERSSCDLTRSDELERSSCDLIRSDEPVVVVSSLPITMGEGMPTPPTQRSGLPAYHMKEEDFPPLVSRRVNRAEIVA